jgi:chromosomal replication initiation ATPase DnaA
LAERPPIRNLINALHDRGLLDIAKAICSQHHVTIDEMLSTNRAQQFVKARRAIISLLVNDKGMSHPFVGRLLGLDQSTVQYSAKVSRVNRPSE